MSIILNNRNEEGLFYTWINLFPQFENHNDIDSVVNANAVLYLGEREETMDTIQYLNNIILEDKENKSYWYYLNDLSLYYMVSRAYFNGVEGLAKSKDAIIRKIISKQKKNGSFGDELRTALAVSTLLNFNYDKLSILMKSVDLLLETQNDDGFWKRIAFYTGPRYPAPNSVWHGAEALTTALCVEALARFKRLINHPTLCCNPEHQSHQ